MSFKPGEVIYIFNGISGEIMKSTYGGKSWQEELGLISRDRNELQKWISAIKNENKIRLNRG